MKIYCSMKHFKKSLPSFFNLEQDYDFVELKIHLIMFSKIMILISLLSYNMLFSVYCKRK